MFDGSENIKLDGGKTILSGRKFDPNTDADAWVQVKVISIHARDDNGEWKKGKIIKFKNSRGKMQTIFDIVRRIGFVK